MQHLPFLFRHIILFSFLIYVFLFFYFLKHFKKKISTIFIFSWISVVALAHYQIKNKDRKRSSSPTIYVSEFRWNFLFSPKKFLDSRSIILAINFCVYQSLQVRLKKIDELKIFNFKAWLWPCVGCYELWEARYDNILQRSLRRVSVYLSGIE